MIGNIHCFSPPEQEKNYENRSEPTRCFAQCRGLRGRRLCGEYAKKFVWSPVSAKEAEKEPEVTATEDLMREHGVIRRALLVYFETVPGLQQNPGQRRSNLSAASGTIVPHLRRGLPLKECWKSNTLFPLVRKHGGEPQRYADILTAQHDRGREITNYMLAVSNGPKIGGANAEPLAKVSRVLSSGTNITRRARTQLFFRHGKRTSRTSNSMKFPISSRISNTRCSAKTALTMPRRRSAASKERRALPISHSSLHRHPRRRKFNC